MRRNAIRKNTSVVVITATPHPQELGVSSTRGPQSRWAGLRVAAWPARTVAIEAAARFKPHTTFALPALRGRAGFSVTTTSRVAGRALRRDARRCRRGCRRRYGYAERACPLICRRCRRSEKRPRPARIGLDGDDAVVFASEVVARSGRSAAGQCAAVPDWHGGVASAQPQAQGDLATGSEDGIKGLLTSSGRKTSCDEERTTPSRARRRPEKF
jgi:hypothetical protein